MSAPFNDGGPAFPKPLDPYPNMQGAERGCHGMSLRDWFAGQALAVVAGGCHKVGSDFLHIEDYPSCAAAAYALADAMIAAREAKP